MKRRDHVATQKTVYCSRECSSATRRREGAKWRDKAAIRAYMRDYTERHRAETNARCRRRNKTHRLEKIAATQRYRARLKKATTIEPVNYAKILKRDGLHCHICRNMVAPEEVGFDHVIPLARGGAHVASNIAVCHRRCNSRKGDRVATLF